ncbi:MAG TPA: hypothetical protein EYP85_13435 [Armatimonadetes bacterium]|nr:hypothetical protein [Armatimonadota bacterium]
MYKECCQGLALDRRDFLRCCGGMAFLATSAMEASGATAHRAREPAKEPLPTIALGEHRVTRLIAGYNPIGGHSHSTLNLARHMREYFTVERTAEFLLHCERQGINTWQYDHTEKVQKALRLAREKGCGLQLICLHAERPHDAPLKEVMKFQPIAIVHHGGVTDALFRAGKAQQVRDFVKKVHDCGVLAGVSAHNPENIKRMVDEGWENDFFMTCFYYVTRPREEMRRELGKVPVGEPFFESDPEDMTQVIRSIDKPCLAFKILAAGRRCWSRSSVEKAFQYAFSRLKKTDAVIVGMFPRYTDEVSENAAYTRKYGGV